MNKRLIQLKKTLGKFISNFSVTSEDGMEYIFDGDVVREGLEVNTYDENGDIIPLVSGEYTIAGIEVIVVDGIVSELPEKESKVEEGEGETEPATAEPTKLETEDSEEIAALRAENETLRAELESVRAELTELKNKPLADAVPQRTQMSTDVVDNAIPDSITGTKYEKAYRILNK